MPWVTPVTTVEAEFSGVGGGWTDITADVTDDPIAFEYGIRGYRPEDRCASAGPIRFNMRNDANNSGAQLGYYSLFHASKRSGWAPGIRVRVKQTYGGATRYKLGRLAEAPAEPGQYEGRKVMVVAMDYMDELARANVPTALQQNKRSDEVFSAILANMSTQPGATSIATGKSTFVQCLDNVGAETKGLTQYADLSRSELGQIFCKRDATIGETLTFESRHTRVAIATTLVTLDNTMHALGLPGRRSDILNRFRVTTHPRLTSGYTSITVAQIDAAFQSAIAPGETYAFFLDYTLPADRSTKIGATNQVAPVATTDYTMNANADGSGADLTANFTVTPTYFGAAVKLTVTNGGATAGYIRTMKVRGDGILALNPVVSEEKNSASMTTYGDNPAEIDMVMQGDPYIGSGAAAYFSTLYANPLANVTFVKFCANQSDALMTAAITGEISSRVALVESVNGLLSTQLYYINGIAIEIEEFEKMEVTWWLTPADASSYWILDTSELDISTRLAFI